MPFTFKLSRRLACSRKARTWLPLAVALATVLGCEPVRSLSSDNPLSSLVVKPDSVILDPSDRKSVV